MVETNRDCPWSKDPLRERFPPPIRRYTSDIKLADESVFLTPDTCLCVRSVACHFYQPQITII